MYRVVRFLFFLLPAEAAHYLAMDLLTAACSIPFLRKIIRRRFTPPSQIENFCGLSFRNRTGLGAGFDKNAKYLRELEALGFGFVEVGTVTPKPQAGNDKPRLFRLKKDGALINRMGFNNDGVDTIARRLRTWRQDRNSRLTIDDSRFTLDASRFLIGGNIGKNKTTPNEEAWKDYEICFLGLYDHVDFFVVNVSSPNTPGLRELQEKDSLRKILSHLQQLNAAKPKKKPVLLKIAPDLTDGQLDDVISLAKEIGLDGIVATNTTISREGLHISTNELQTIGAGGLSGKPLTKRSTEVIHYIHQRAPELPIIGSGGIFAKADAEEKIDAGATLVEVWTGFIYEGPSIVKKVT
jgi:dihydroorotate dehydrogenase